MEMNFVFKNSFNVFQFIKLDPAKFPLSMTGVCLSLDEKTSIEMVARKKLGQNYFAQSFNRVSVSADVTYNRSLLYKEDVCAFIGTPQGSFMMYIKLDELKKLIDWAWKNSMSQ